MTGPKGNSEFVFPAPLNIQVDDQLLSVLL